MISLSAYRLLEDAWTDGVAEWCRAASPFVLSGGRAWMVTVSDGQANWIKQRLLAEGVSLFGVQFLDARALRRELCLRAGLTPPSLGRETLQFLLRLHAVNAASPGTEWSAVARHPEACLAALDDFAAAGWLDELGLVDDMLPSALSDWLPQLRATGSWTPEVDRRLAEFFAAAPPGPSRGPLSVCVFGWDAHAWDRFDLLDGHGARRRIGLPLPAAAARHLGIHPASRGSKPAKRRSASSDATATTAALSPRKPPSPTGSKAPTSIPPPTPRPCPRRNC